MTEWIITASVLILIIMAVRYALRGKIGLRMQYALWALVLLRLLVPATLGTSAVSVMNPVVDAAGGEVYYDNMADIIDAEYGYDGQVSSYDGEVLMPSIGGGARGLNGHEVEFADGSRGWFTLTDKGILQLIIRWTWYAGIAAVGITLLLSNLSFGRKLKKTRKEFDAPDCPLWVYVVPALPSPCLFGLFPPAVYITPEVAADKKKLRHVLAHEYTHYRHGDHIWSALRGAALALHWYNPLVWLAAALSKRDAELACDEGALLRIGEENRAEYGRTLIGLTCEKPRAMDLLCTATTMTGGKNAIKERIKLIAKHPKTAAITLIVLLLVAALAVGCTFTGAKEEVVFTPDKITIYCGETSNETDAPDTVDAMVELYNGLKTTGESEWIGDPQFLSLIITDSEMDKSVSLDISSYGLARINTDSTCYSLENGKAIYAEIYGVFSNLAEESVGPPAVDDTAPGSVAEDVDVPDAVLRVAKNKVAECYDTACEDFPDYEYSDWRIASLEWVDAYDDIIGMALDIYRMNYEFLSEAPESIMLAGGMTLTDDGWVCPTYPDCTYLVFDADSDAFCVVMMENDCYPGGTTFTEELTEKLEDTIFPQYDAQFTPTDGILEQAVSYPYDLDFRGYVTDLSETSVSVDEIVWDTEGDYPNGYAIINDDTSVAEYALAENCEFWILKDYWFPCQRLDFETFSGFLETDKAFTDQYGSDTPWVFAENENGEIVMIGMQYRP